MQTWLWWATIKHFVVLNGNSDITPTYAIVARPVSWDLVYTTPKGEELFAFDHSGNALWMDFLWAPGQWNVVRDFLIRSGKIWGGWEHRVTGKVHIVEIKKLLMSPPLAIPRQC